MLVWSAQNWSISSRFAQKITPKTPFFYGRVCPKIPAKLANFFMNLSLKIPQNLTFFPQPIRSPDMYILWCSGCKDVYMYQKEWCVYSEVALHINYCLSMFSHIVITVIIAESLNACFCTWDNRRKHATFCDHLVVYPWNDVSRETSADIPYWWRATTQIWVLSASDCLEICFIHYCHQLSVSNYDVTTVSSWQKLQHQRAKMGDNFVHCSVSCYYC